MEDISTESILSGHLHSVISAFPELSAGDFSVQKTRKEFEGDVTITLFHAVKKIRKSPAELGHQIGERLVTSFPDTYSHFKVIQGFLNISFTDTFWLEKFRYIAGQECFGKIPAKENSLPFILEYCSPNTNKPLHLGHLRNIFLGKSVTEILRFRGHRVITANLVNDKGIHICKSMLMWIKDGRKKTPENTGIKGDFLVGDYYVQFDKTYKQQVKELTEKGLSQAEAEEQAPCMAEARELLRKWENNDPEIRSIWQTMNQWVLDGFRQTLQRLNIEFDRWDFESNTYLEGKKAVEEGLKKNIFFKSPDGSVRINLTDEGLDEKVLLRSDGTSVYITQDIGTALLRLRETGDIQGMIYTVGNEQDYHFKVLFTILKKLGYSWAEKCRHLSYGMVELPTGRMKSREGTVVDADDLLDEMYQTAKKITSELGKTEGLSEEEKKKLFEMIGQGALRYFILKVDPRKKMIFNPEESIDFNGNTGPFIQYTHARICSVLRKAYEHPEDVSMDFSLEQIQPQEKDVIRRMFAFPEVLDECVRDLNPAPLAAHLYELSKEYNRFYHDLSILSEPNPDIRRFRIQLSLACGKQIRHGMNCMGIQVPERM